MRGEIDAGVAGNGGGSPRPVIILPRGAGDGGWPLPTPQYVLYEGTRYEYLCDYSTLDEVMTNQVQADTADVRAADLCLLCGRRPSQGDAEEILVDAALCSDCASGWAWSTSPVDAELVRAAGEDPVGTVLEAGWMTTGLWRVRQVSPSGGVVTSLALHLLESGDVSGVVIPGMRGAWQDSHIVARTPEELLDAVGNRVGKTTTIRIDRGRVANLAILASLRALDALDPDGGAWAVVALPCEAYTLARIRHLGLDLARRLKYVIGLLCFTNLPTNAQALRRLEEASGIPLGDIANVRFGEKVTVSTVQGESRAVGLEEALQNAPANCRQCFDTGARFGDISVGQAGAGSGFVTVLARTPAGREAVHRAHLAGYLRTAQEVYPDTPDPARIEETIRESLRVLAERKSTARS